MLVIIPERREGLRYSLPERSPHDRGIFCRVQMKATDTSQGDFDGALERIQELTGALEDTAEEHELVELVHACEDRALVVRLLDIVAAEGLVKPDLLEPNAVLADVGLMLDDLTLIANAIEREFDCNMLPDDEMQACRTVQQLVMLMATRLRAAESGAGAP